MIASVVMSGESVICAVAIGFVAVMVGVTLLLGLTITIGKQRDSIEHIQTDLLQTRAVLHMVSHRNLQLQARLEQLEQRYGMTDDGEGWKRGEL